jgi:hypothetical protein
VFVSRLLSSIVSLACCESLNPLNPSPSLHLNKKQRNNTQRHKQAFSCWAHLAVVRLFVESILRYGLPPAFQAAVVKPLPRMEARLRAVLAGAFGTGAASFDLFWAGAGRGCDMACCCDGVMRACMWHSCVDCQALHPPSTHTRTKTKTTDSEFWQADAGGGGLASSEVDAYPYVSLTINTDAA